MRLIINSKLTVHQRDNQHRMTSRRRAMTLTELLVVVSIVVLLAGMLVPMIKPVMRGRRVREASRQLNVFMTGAQARAIELGRPVGVWMERRGHEPSDPANTWYTSSRLYLAEQPPPYAGDVFDARVVIGQLDPSNPTTWYAFFRYPGATPATAGIFPECCPDVIPSIQQGVPLVQSGDLIRFEGKGPYFVISQIDPNANAFVFLVDPTNSEQISTVQKYARGGVQQSQLGVFQPGVRFEVIRRPVKAAADPIELPQNTGIDLSVSGYEAPFLSPFLPVYPGFVPPVDSLTTRFRAVSPEYDIAIMFSPDGGVDRVHFIAHEPEERPSFWEIPQGNIHLMVARDDQIGYNSNNPPVATQALLNGSVDYTQYIASPLGEGTLSDSDNVWLSIGTQSSRVLVAPNVNGFITNAQTGAAYPLPLTPAGDARPFIINARRFAQSGQTLGGR